MEENSTEMTPQRDEPQGLSIRETMAEHMAADKSEPEPVKREAVNTTQAATPTPSATPERPMLVPPADMRNDEKEAYLNPTPQNAHILQNYLNRRAYETRSEFSRKMAEVEAKNKVAGSFAEVVQQHEDYYTKRGYNLADVAKRSIAWDRAMSDDPVNTAVEWLNSYGLSIEDLMGQGRLNGPAQGQSQAPQQQSQYLTKEQAEAIAQEKLQSYFAEQEKKAVEYMHQQVVDSFVSNKPLFRDPETAAQLEAEMAPIVSALSKSGRYSSPDQVLETAYNYVVNGNPTFSGLVQRMAAKTDVEHHQAVTQKAKQAAKSITGSASSGTPRLQIKDMRENLRRRMTGNE